jgi:hypothetical protein
LVQLTGSYGFADAALRTLFGPGGTLVPLAAGLTQPLFDAGTLRGQLERAKGRYDELLADYRKALIQAFTDVENALTAWRFTTEQKALQRQAVVTAQPAADIARAQMIAGTVDITTVTIAHTLQPWVNLPAGAKMTEPRYQESARGRHAGQARSGRRGSRLLRRIRRRGLAHAQPCAGHHA